MKKPNVCVLRTAGTNCDMETAAAFRKAGAESELVHINKFIKKSRSLDNYHILAIPGGFTYGDDIGAGKILANELRHRLGRELNKFISDGKLIIGICNGFQVLVKSGLLPGNGNLIQEASLIINDCGSFVDKWVFLRSKTKRQGARVDCVWTKGLPEIIYLPIAHGEGKFVVKDNAVLSRLKKNGQIVLQYCDGNGELGGYPYNPNGSLENIAGICDETGRIFGLMPHPERHMDVLQGPGWTGGAGKKTADGSLIFTNGVEYARKSL